MSIGCLGAETRGVGVGHEEADHLRRRRDGEAGHAKWDIARRTEGYANAAPVGRFQPNGFGLNDRHDNVWISGGDCKGAARCPVSDQTG